jgi:hypothetical protein
MRFHVYIVSLRFHTKYLYMLHVTGYQPSGFKVIAGYKYKHILKKFKKKWLYIKRLFIILMRGISICCLVYIHKILKFQSAAKVTRHIKIISNASAKLYTLGCYAFI